MEILPIYTHSTTNLSPFPDFEKKSKFFSKILFSNPIFKSEFYQSGKWKQKNARGETDFPSIL